MIKDAHQPYFYRDQLYHCRRAMLDERVIWRPYVDEDSLDKIGRWPMICSLVPCQHGISFVSGFLRSRSFVYSLRFWHSELDKIFEIEKNSQFGFAKKDLFVTQKDRRFDGFYLNTRASFVEVPIKMIVSRIVPVEIDENWLLISGCRERRDVTLVYDYARNEWIGRLCIDGDDIYKSCLSACGCHYAIRSGPDFEDRSIKFSQTWQLTELE